MVRTRFAPSPTGRLHLGHALAAQVAFELAATAPHGEFLLRHEDLDQPRVRPEFYAEIEADLRWLGITWSGEPLRQSSRQPAYEAALSRLRGLNLLYPCFCTRREILAEAATITSAPHGSEGPLYPSTCRRLGRDQQQANIAAGIAHSWRFDAAAAAARCGVLTFQDLRFGLVAVDEKLLGDVVLARKDIGPAYHLAVVVDDAFQQITHVSRGEDLLPATHVQRLLQQLLGLPEPVYLHHPLISDAAGKRLAKRADAASIAAYRAAGISPAELLSRITPALAAYGKKH
jgi:glutamyl-Q tRNA(Asp) synthetase